MVATEFFQGPDNHVWIYADGKARRLSHIDKEIIDWVLLKVATKTYRELFDKEPVVRAIHAGLECGLFSEKYPGMDMISVGPTLRGVHSPDECLLIPTVEMVWKHMVRILEEL